MSDLVLSPVTSGYNLSLINENFQSIQDRINDYCLQNKEGKNVLNQGLDMNGYALLNLETDFSNNGSMVTVGDAKSHFYQIGLVPDTVNDGDAVNYGQVSQMLVSAGTGEIPANVALYSELALTSGASLIGYATGLTVKNKLDNLTTSVTNNTNVINSNTTAINNNSSAISANTASIASLKSSGLIYSKDYVDLQSALNAAVGKTLIVEPKSHNITVALKIKSNTTMYCYGATFVRAAAIDNLLRNDADGITGGYGANTNITILGGTWDGATATYPGTSATLIALGHCSNITLRDVTAKNTTGFHHIEVNSSSNVLIDNCDFSGGAEQALSTMEAIQIDAAIGSAEFPWFGPYDNTICDGVTVSNCKFTNVGSGIGTHTDPASQHINITITSNTFIGTFYAAIRGQAWSGTTVANNKINGGYHGILATPAAAFGINNWIVSGNSVENVGNSAYVGTQGRPIGFGSIASALVSIVTCTGNVVRNCNSSTQHGIFFNATQKFTCSGNEVDSVNNNGIYCTGASFGTVIGNHSTLASGFSFAVDASSSDIVICHNRGATASITASTKCIYKDNILATSSTVSTMTSSSTTPNLVNGTAV